MHLQRARSGFLICRCTASPISWNQCSNRSYKRCDNVQPPIWEPDQTEIGTRSKKQNTAINLLTVSALSSVCCSVHCRERKREMHQERIPESRRMAGTGVGNRRCLKVPIFADSVRTKGCCRRCSEPGWCSGSPCMTLRMPRGFLVYTQPVSMKWQSDWIMSRHPWSLSSRVMTLGTSQGVRSLQNHTASADVLRLGWPLA